MSGYITERLWHLKHHVYVYYRFLVNQKCQRSFKGNRCLALDAGCGSNVCSLPAVPEHASLVGVDINHESIVKSHRKAKRKGYGNFDFIVATVTSLPFRRSTFKLALCVDVLEHLPAKREALREISRTCKARGELVGSTSNFLNPLLMFDCLAPKNVAESLTQRFAGKHQERHWRFTVSTLVRTLRDEGFKVCVTELVGFPVFRPWLYEFSDKKLPWYAHLWIAFDKLTKKKPLNLLKEMVVFHAVKTGSQK